METSSPSVITTATSGTEALALMGSYKTEQLTVWEQGARAHLLSARSRLDERLAGMLAAVATRNEEVRKTG